MQVVESDKTTVAATVATTVAVNTASQEPSRRSPAAQTPRKTPHPAPHGLSGCCASRGMPMGTPYRKWPMSWA